MTPKDRARNIILGAIETAVATHNLAETETPSTAEKIDEQMRNELARLENRWGFSQ